MAVAQNNGVRSAPAVKTLRSADSTGIPWNGWLSARGSERKLGEIGSGHIAETPCCPVLRGGSSGREFGAHQSVLRAGPVTCGYLVDESRIVRMFAMQALADLAERDATLRKDVLTRIERLTATGTPAMRARGRELLKCLRSSPHA